uniref:PIK-related kinase FAT domain-containing protein n=1 Tax=Hucho hucho TaxID=62062 RepID=A0A4W5QTN7_9TELE
MCVLFQCIDKARDLLDAELTAKTGESYSRAYKAMVSCQLLLELEEVIQYKLFPEKRDIIRDTWWERLQRIIEDWQRILMVCSLVINLHDDMRTWLKYASHCGKSGRLHFVQRMQQQAQHAIATEDKQHQQELHKLMARPGLLPQLL